MDQGFSKEVINKKSEIIHFLNYYKNDGFKKEVIESLNQLKNIDFDKYSVLIENLIAELQIIIYSKNNYDDSVTMVFRNKGYDKFYIKGCKFISNEFKEDIPKIVLSILEGNYSVTTFKRAGKILTNKVMLLGTEKKSEIGVFNCFKRPNAIEKNKGTSVLSEKLSC